MIDPLSEEFPSYQDTPVPIPPATSPEVCSPDITNPVAEEGAASPSFAETRLHLHKDLREEGEGEGRSQLFPLRAIGGLGNQVQYWPFSASDLYNWKTHNPPFSKDPLALMGLIESILLNHQPTWNYCQQLLQALLTTEERQ